MKNIIDKTWGGDFLVNHERKSSLKDVEFKKGEPFKVRLIRKLNNNRGMGVMEVLLTVAVIIVFILIALKWHNDEPDWDRVDNGTMSATAGMTYYMARLEYHSMQGATPDYDVIDNYIQSVSEPSFMEEAQELAENYKHLEESAEESSAWFTSVMNVFGYAPEDWEIEEAIQMTMDENGYQDDETVADTFSVICNRVRSSQFPNTIHEVLYQRNQFQPVVDGTVGKFTITDRVREICSDVISEGVTNTEILYFTAGDYNPYCEPMYHRGNVYYGK